MRLPDLAMEVLAAEEDLLATIPGFRGRPDLRCEVHVPSTSDVARLRICWRGGEAFRRLSATNPRVRRLAIATEALMNEVASRMTPIEFKVAKGYRPLGARAFVTGLNCTEAKLWLHRDGKPFRLTVRAEPVRHVFLEGTAARMFERLEADLARDGGQAPLIEQAGRVIGLHATRQEHPAESSGPPDRPGRPAPTRSAIDVRLRPFDTAPNTPSREGNTVTAPTKRDAGTTGQEELPAAAPR